MTNKKFAIISLHPAPYRDDLYSHLYKNGYIFDLFVLDKLDFGHSEWKYNGPKLNINYIGNNFIKLIISILKNNYSLIFIPGYSRLVPIVILIYSLLFNRNFVLISDSISEESSNFCKKFFKKLIYRKAKYIYVPGAASRDFFESNGIGSANIIEGAYCFDSIFINKDIISKRFSRNSIRRKYSIPEEDFVILAVGKMIKKRNYQELVNSFNRVSPILPITLLIVGYGPEEINILNSISSQKIMIIKSLPFSHLSEIYSASDLYIHPGAEPFSTATEYAAIAGLPIICSINVGYYKDILRLGVRHYSIDPDNNNDIFDKIMIAYSQRFIDYNDINKNSTLAMARNLDWAMSNFLITLK